MVEKNCRSTKVTAVMKFAKQRLSKIIICGLVDWIEAVVKNDGVT